MEVQAVQPKVAEEVLGRGANGPKLYIRLVEVVKADGKRHVFTTGLDQGALDDLLWEAMRQKKIREVISREVVQGGIGRLGHVQRNGVKAVAHIRPGANMKGAPLGNGRPVTGPKVLPTK